MKVRNKTLRFSVEHDGQLFDITIHVNSRGSRWQIYGCVGHQQGCRPLIETGKKFQAVKAALTAILPPADLITEA